MDELDIEVRSADVLNTKINAHIVIREGGEFLGDFAVEYTENRDGSFCNDDNDGFRHVGGIYANRFPGMGIMRAVAEMVADETGEDIEQHFR